ncbi:MAG: MmgE/PrpD family protein [Methanobacteriaceae archaeon]|nr:MmgE/PrpD family protein [Methanobacteriaceae archaeon]
MFSKDHEKPRYSQSITRDLADFIVSTEYHDLPESVVEQSKLCFLDFLSVTLAGSRTKSARIIRKIISGDIESGGLTTSENFMNDKSTIIGWGKSNPMDAALANGVSAHSLDLDDGHRLAHLHPGACVIPAALALSEVYGKSGKDFITSLVVGYQVAIHLGMTLNPQHRNKGFHSTGTCGTLGAAAAASKIMELNLKEVLNALGIAGTQAAGLLESDHAGSMAKHLHAGKAAQTGLLSALLASEGFTGACTILEGREGLFKAMSSMENLEKNVHWKNQDKYEIMGVYFKKYPVCRHLHSSLDAVINLMSKNKLNPTDIQNITVETYEIAASHANYQPETVEGIRQSLPVSIAIAIQEGKLTVENISTILDSSGTHLDVIINELAGKVKIKLDEKENNLYPLKRPSKVTIKCEGNVYTERVELAKGEPENPFSENELLEKFKDLNPHVKTGCLQILKDLECEKLVDVMQVLNNGLKIREK